MQFEYLDAAEFSLLIYFNPVMASVEVCMILV